jgi:hypothetical protein
MLYLGFLNVGKPKTYTVIVVDNNSMMIQSILIKANYPRKLEQNKNLGFW